MKEKNVIIGSKGREGATCESYLSLECEGGKWAWCELHNMVGPKAQPNKEINGPNLVSVASKRPIAEA